MADAGLLQQPALAGVEVPAADEQRVDFIGCRKSWNLPRHRAPSPAQRGGERHPVEVTGLGRLGRIQIAMRVEPDDARARADTRERAQACMTVAREHDRDAAGFPYRPHRARNGGVDLDALLDLVRGAERRLYHGRARDRETFERAM